MRGLVQGVGFRPFVHELAVRLRLGGHVQNHAGGVLIEVEGEPGALERFLLELTSNPPPLAHVAEVRWAACATREDTEFRIEASTAEPDQVWVGPDVATCEKCRAELFDPGDRRHRYPFLNCTHCGPRLTIIRSVPYDRERTTLAAFPMCAACQKEYDDPCDRRFHAQPTACPTCGPRLALLGADRRRIETHDPLADVVLALRRGEIGALKGLGGYHLVCAACNERAVAELRRRKHRDEKAFAVMVGDLSAAERLCEVASLEKELLLSPRRPIVLLRKRQGERVAESVAPGNPYLGVMLPYTPLHHLLLHDLHGLPLVMTSANRCDEPIAFEDHDALERLQGIADFFLTHDRPIHLRCDDSVTRVVAGKELPVRRSRGQTPQPLLLPFPCPVPILAVGGQLKATFALGQEGRAILSHHLGDLEHYVAYQAYVEAMQHYERLFAIEPEWVVHDLHPDYASTRYALARGPKHLAVQHHHAHVASCMAENGLTEPVIGVAFDGTGLGSDSTIWGGEFLVGDYRGFRRAAHLRSVPLPGSDRAIREPWRMAVAHLVDAGEGHTLLEGKIPDRALRTLEQMIAGQVNAPLTSSAGRLFDAIAALADVRLRVSYEGQAAQELEWLASEAAPDISYPFELTTTEEGDPPQATLVIDTRPLIRAVAQDARAGVSAARIGRRFHSTLVDTIAEACGRLRTQTGLDAVILSGGVFLNALLLSEVTTRLVGDAFRVYRHRLVPPNDGGLCLGQLAIAAQLLSQRV